jgi:hypothetical protein
MLYIGLGNAGSRMLWSLRRLLRLDVSPPRTESVSWWRRLFGGSPPLRIAPPPPATDDLRFAVADADPNNNVLAVVRAGDFARRHPPQGVRIYEIDWFWSGGCGVYHIIGELVAEAAHRAGCCTRLLADVPPEHAVTLLFSTGGGTGGGVSEHLSQCLAATGRQVRLFTALPEVDPTPDAGPVPQINGPDDFQCASAGRFLTRFLAAPGGRDLFLLSNSALGRVPAPGPTYGESIDRLNGYLNHVLLLMPPVVGQQGYAPAGRTVTIGLGLSACPAEDDGWAAALADELVRSALTALDLTPKAASGLSALPLEASVYPAALSMLLAGNPPAGSAGAQLGRAFQHCRAVNGWLWARTPQVFDRLAATGLPGVVTGAINRLFVNVPVTVQLMTRHGVAPDCFRNGLPAEFFPGLVDGKDVALLLLLDGLIVEDVYRLLVYFLESSFEWRNGNVDTVAGFVDGCLGSPDSALGQTTAMLTRLTTADGVEPYLEADAAEAYPPRFWGNIDDLRYKVLQSLNLTPEHFNAKLLRPEMVAGALAHLWRQVH